MEHVHPGTMVDPDMVDSSDLVEFLHPVPATLVSIGLEALIPVGRTLSPGGDIAGVSVRRKPWLLPGNCKLLTLRDQQTVKASSGWQR